MSGIGSFLGFSRDRGLDGGIFNLKEQNYDFNKVYNYFD
jgi:hypothetical protein